MVFKKSSDETTSSPYVQKDVKVSLQTHPEGGWGWFVVTAACTVQFIVIGLQNSSGVVFAALVNHYHQSSGATAWIGSLGIGMMFLCGPLTTSLVERYGPRIVSMTGGFLCVFGLTLSSFASSLNIMYITYGVTWGLGSSFCYFPTLIVLVQYFDRRLALVNGIVTAGSGFGTLVISPLLQVIIDEVGVMNALRILAFLHGIALVCGLVYRPVDEKFRTLQSEPITKVDGTTGPSNVERSIWREKAYVVWTIGLSTFMLGYFVPFVHLQKHAELIGIDSRRASFLIAVLSVTSTIGKVLMGRIADIRCLNRLTFYQFGLLSMSVSTTLVPIGKTYAALVVYALVFGLFEACFVVMIPLLTKDIVGVRRLSPALGSLFMIMATPTMLGAPVAGWIYDSAKSYSTAFFVAGGQMTAGVLLMYLIPLLLTNSKTSGEILNILPGEATGSGEELLEKYDVKNSLKDERLQSSDLKNISLIDSNKPAEQSLKVSQEIGYKTDSSLLPQTRRSYVFASWPPQIMHEPSSEALNDSVVVERLSTV